MTRDYYPLANPWLAEANDSSTVVPRAGADRSLQHNIPGTNCPQSQHLSEEGDSIHEGEGNGNDFGASHQAKTKAGDKGEGFVDNCHKARTKATGDRHQDETKTKNKSYGEVTAPLRRLLNRYKEGENSYQTLKRMMDSRTYLAPRDPNRKRHLTGGTKDEADTK